MRKNLMGGLIASIFVTIAVFLALDSRGETYAVQMDARFKDYKFYTCVKNIVGSYGLKSDGYTFKDSALENIYDLNCDDSEITSVKGINLMKNLTSLRLANNKISGIDLSKNTKLTSINLRKNKLKSLNVSKNINLGSVVVSNNKLSSLDLSKNTKLYYLIVSNNQLSNASLNLNNVNKLTYLELYNNNFTSKPTKCTQLGSSCTFGYIIKFSSYDGIHIKNITYVDSTFTPTRTGYTFVGWYKDSSLTSRVTLPFSPDKDMTLYAKWTRALAQEEEELLDDEYIEDSDDLDTPGDVVVDNNTNGFNNITIIVIALFVAACLGFLAYTFLHAKSKNNKSE